MSMQGNANSVANASSSFGGISEPPRRVELSGDSMDVDMDVDMSETTSPSTGPYKVVTIPGIPPAHHIEFPEGFEEEEAEMSSDEDNEDEEAEEFEEGRSTEISISVLLEKPIDETDDAEDGDYVPNE